MPDTSLSNLLTSFSSVLWSEYCLIPLLAGVGVYLTVGLRGFPWRRIGQAGGLLWRGRRPEYG